MKAEKKMSNFSVFQINLQKLTDYYIMKNIYRLIVAALLLSKLNIVFMCVLCMHTRNQTEIKQTKKKSKFK